MGLEELVKAIVEWGREREIDNPLSQYAKVNEEVGEIAHELTRGRFDSDELVDGIGDTLVTIIILADILGIDVREALQMAYDTIKNRKGHNVGGSFVKEEE